MSANVERVKRQAFCLRTNRNECKIVVWFACLFVYLYEWAWECIDTGAFCFFAFIPTAFNVHILYFIHILVFGVRSSSEQFVEIKSSPSKQCWIVVRLAFFFALYTLYMYRNVHCTYMRRHRSEKRNEVAAVRLVFCFHTDILRVIQFISFTSAKRTTFQKPANQINFTTFRAMKSVRRCEWWFIFWRNSNN